MQSVEYIMVIFYELYYLQVGGQLEIKTIINTDLVIHFI